MTDSEHLCQLRDQFSPGQLSAYPVNLVPNRQKPSSWYPYAVSDLKELKIAIREDGVHSPWTKSILQGYLQSLNTPQDWRGIMRAVLPSPLFLQWEAFFRDECLQQARRNTEGQPDWNFDALFGTGCLSTGILQAEARFPPGYFDQVRLCAMQAWDRLTPPTGESPAPILSLCQERDESLSKFITRVQASLERKFSDPNARQLLLKTIVWEGMLPDFRQACLSLKNETPSQWILATQEIESSTHQATTLAQAFAAALDKQKGACFQCGREGHWRNQCFKGKQGPRTPSGNQKAKTLCSRCQKGYHQRKECRSKTHKDGTPLPDFDKDLN